MSNDPDKTPAKSSRAQIDAFLRAAANPAAGARGRLIFAMDATASRQPAWDTARRIQSRMFEETAAIGGLDVQLCYFRGQREFSAGPWLSDSAQLLKAMGAVSCAGGRTQVEQVLRHALREHASSGINALVLVGDAMEEKPRGVTEAARELGDRGVPAFLFQEGSNPAAKRAFGEIAKLTGGAWSPFDTNSAEQLRDLLSAVAVFATGGRQALEAFGQRQGKAVQQLAHQLGPSRDK